MVTLFGRFLGMNHLNMHTKYLGLPLTVRRNRKETFRYLEDKMQVIIMGGKGSSNIIRFEFIPLYAMGCFKIPTTLCDKMTALALNFWWNDTKK